MKCGDVKNYLCEFIDDLLTLEIAGSIKEHLKSCSVCEKEYLRLKKTVDLVRELDGLDAPPDIIVNVNKMLDNEPFFKRLSGYIANIWLYKLPYKAITIAIVAVLIIYLNYKNQPTVKKLKEDALKKHYSELADKRVKADEDTLIEEEPAKVAVGAKETAKPQIKRKIGQEAKPVAKKEVRRADVKPDADISPKSEAYKEPLKQKAVDEVVVKEAEKRARLPELDETADGNLLIADADRSNEYKKREDGALPVEKLKSQLTYEVFGEESDADDLAEDNLFAKNLLAKNLSKPPALPPQLSAKEVEPKGAEPELYSRAPRERKLLLEQGEKTIPAYDKAPVENERQKQRVDTFGASVIKEEEKEEPVTQKEGLVGFDRTKSLKRKKEDTYQKGYAKDSLSRVVSDKKVKKPRVNYYKIRVKDLQNAKQDIISIAKTNGAYILEKKESINKIKIRVLVLIKNYDSFIKGVTFNRDVAGDRIIDIKLKESSRNMKNKITKKQKTVFLTVEIELTL